MKVEDIKRMANSILDSRKIENEFIEYKKSAIFKDKILKTSCAYANNYMNCEIGLIFIGVEEKENKETGIKAIPKMPIVGVEEVLIETTENNLKRLLSNIHPKIQYHLVINEYKNKKYIIVAVEPGNKGPYQTSDKAERDKSINLKSGRYIRTKRDTILPNSLEEFELLKKFYNKPFSSMLNSNATLEDLNYEYMKEYLVLTNAKEDIKNLSKLDMARSLGLISESEFGGYRAKNFAVLMFCDKPSKFIPGAYVKVIREISGTDKMEAKDFDGPVWLQAKQVNDYFKNSIMTSYTIREHDKIEHKIVYNYPLTAFEELATNAIVHKEYDVDEYVGIYIYSDKISFVNHNRPLPPITIEMLNSERSFDRRQYVNRELKDMFFALNLIESYGSGIRRTKDSLEENGSPKLKYIQSGEEDNVTNAIVEINKEFIGGTSRETSRETSSKKLILTIIKENPDVRIPEIARLTGLSYGGVRYQMDNLRKTGHLKREGSTKAGRWIVIEK